MKAFAVPVFIAAALSGSIACGDDLLTSQHPVNYRIVKLADLGGMTASGNSINDVGLVAGFSDLPDGNSRHAMLWLYGFKFDLGTLGGPNSNVAWPNKNTIGLIAGIAQTDVAEPLGQTWSCRSFFAFTTRSGFICLGVVWENGQIRALPTLGGYNGFATGANNHRQIVGWAQNTVLDPTCNPIHVKQQFRAVIWGPEKDQIQELPPLGDDSTSAATAINDKGQVVGISGICGTAVGAASATTLRHLGERQGAEYRRPWRRRLEHSDGDQRARRHRRVLQLLRQRRNRVQSARFSRDRSRAHPGSRRSAGHGYKPGAGNQRATASGGHFVQG